MPRALIVAFCASLALHVAALVGLQIDLAQPPERPPLLAELVMPPRPQPAEEKKTEVPLPARPPKAKSPPVAPAKVPIAPVPEAEPTPRPEVVAPEPIPPLAAPRIAGRGVMRFRVFRGVQAMEVGRAEHEWEFAEGRYRLTAFIETTGLAVLFKSVRIEQESQGKLLAGGLRPERFITRRNGVETNEGAEFDWAAKEVALARSGSRHPVTEGAQDLLSFYYQLAYLPGLAEGTTLGVATSRKFEHYRLQVVGEELLETEVETFRTLHLKVQTETNTTELWVALDRGLLPVKIRHIDRKGEVFDQIVNEIGTPQQ
ncbi:MAG: hypothetical protein BWY57_00337 [Betaproteobacteria bacterium ADurb.Bin341]|nr:MAG: hypothetical protein BWY57_00337 [Betaproteobacteria bacterium ADurb.Bin341]